MSFEVELKLTMPKPDVFRNKPWLAKIKSALFHEGEVKLRKLFEQTVNGWSDKPKFKYEINVSQSEGSLRMYADDSHAGDIWRLVSAGSPPHAIYPTKQGGMLKFRPGYLASTSPGSIMSRRAYRSGQPVTARAVSHPGFDPRDFPSIIEDEFFRTYVDDMQNAFNEAARG